jgi:hypothetical protein
VVTLYHPPNCPVRFWGPRTLLLLNTRGFILGGKEVWTSSWSISVGLVSKLWMSVVVSLSCCLFILLWDSQGLFLSFFLSYSDLSLPTRCRCRRYCYTWSYSITQTRSKIPLDKGSVRRRDLYLTTHNIHKDSYAPDGIRNRYTSSKRTHNYTLDRSATGTGFAFTCSCIAEDSFFPLSAGVYSENGKDFVYRQYR